MVRIDVVAHWMALHEALGIGVPIRDEAQYAQVVKFAESLADELPDDAGDPRWGLVHLLADRIKEHEDRVHPMPHLPEHELRRGKALAPRVGFPLDVFLLNDWVGLHTAQSGNSSKPIRPSSGRLHLSVIVTIRWPADGGRAPSHYDALISAS